jgi:hypothetical protein
MAAESIYKNRVGLTEITIANFKGVKERVTIPIRPITMLYGANSAGKSTIIHALAYLREIVCNNNPDADQTEIGGESIRLGGFRNMVHDYDLGKSIWIGVNFSLEDDGLSSLLNQHNEEGIEEDPPGEEAEKFLNEVVNCGIRISVKYSKTENRPLVETFEILINGEILTDGSRGGRNDLPELTRINHLHPLLEMVYGKKSIDSLSKTFFSEQEEQLNALEKKHGDKMRQFLEKVDYCLPFSLQPSNPGMEFLESLQRKGKKYSKGKKVTDKDIPFLLYCTWGKDGMPEDDLIELGEFKELLKIWYINNADFLNEIVALMHQWSCNISFPLMSPHKYEYIEDKSKYSIFDQPLIARWEMDMNESDAETKIKEIQACNEGKYDFSKFDELAGGVADIVQFAFNGSIALCRRELEKLSYIGPIRVIPTSLNAINQGEKRTAKGDWATGKAAWELLRRDYDTEKKELGLLIANVNEWMNAKDKMDMGYKLDISHRRMIDNKEEGVLFQLAEDGLEFAFADDSRRGEFMEGSRSWERFLEWYNKLPFLNFLILTQYGKQLNLSPKSVGVGITQVLPILTAASHSEMGLITVEQPELHLHPKVQCNLSDVFIESVKGGSKSYILESHSEHLILRIKKRIREGKLHPSDVSVLFVNPANAERGCDTQRLRLDEEGEFIDEWPDGFFEEGYQEIFGGN